MSSSSLPFDLGPRDLVLVLAPHPDDLEVACGGTIRLLADGGVHVVQAVITDGANGTRLPAPDDWDEESARRYCTTVDAREGATLEAASILGVEATFFFRYPDGLIERMPASRERIADKLGQLLDALGATRGRVVLFAPCHGDRHPDHAEVASAADALLAARPRLISRALRYQVWMEERPALERERLAVVELGESAWQAKLEALACHDPGVFTGRRVAAARAAEV